MVFTGTDRKVLYAIARAMGVLLQTEDQMATLSEAVDKMTSSVEQNTSVTSSLNDTIKQIVDHLHTTAGDLDAAGEQAAADKINALADELAANTQRITDAVVANTGAAGETHT